MRGRASRVSFAGTSQKPRTQDSAAARPLCWSGRRAIAASSFHELRKWKTVNISVSWFSAYDRTGLHSCRCHKCARCVKANEWQFSPEEFSWHDITCPHSIRLTPQVLTARHSFHSSILTSEDACPDVLWHGATKTMFCCLCPVIAMWTIKVWIVSALKALIAITG